MASMSAKVERNVVFFGETGTGKSSAINLLLKSDTRAKVSNDVQPCTREHACYEVTLHGKMYKLWDTRGLGGGVKFFRFLFGGKSEKELKKALKERHENSGIDLLVYCIRGSRTPKASLNYYNTFCSITRQLAAPVVVVVTNLEKYGDMEDWWTKNSVILERYNMKFDGYACVTTLPNHRLTSESKTKLVDVITREYHWMAEGGGSYFGSRGRTSNPPPVPTPPTITISNTLKPNENSRDPIHRHSSTAPSTIGDSSSVTTNAGESLPPAIKRPIHSSVLAAPRPPPIDTGCSCPPRTSNEDTSSTGSSGLDPSPYSSQTSHSGLSPCTYPVANYELKPCTDGKESKEPFRYSGATVRRRAGFADRRGGFGDIWRCDLIFGETPRMVAVKVVNPSRNGDRNPGPRERVLRRELKVWEKLSHDHIVPLLGIVSGFGPLPSMVSPWFHNGSLSSYLARRKTSMIHKHRLLGDISAGLCYLHSQEVVHGDLHSDNVLIDDLGRACLTDFGLSLIAEFVGSSYLGSSILGSLNFADPALVQRANGTGGEVVYPSEPCDVYSFGGLMLHVLSGKRPYDGLAYANVVMNVMRGERPQIPPDDIPQWHESLMRRCWDQDEHKRPTARDLVELFDRE